MGISSFELSVLAGKTAAVMIVLLGLYRVLGKRSLGQFTAYDLVTIMAVANSVQNAMTSGRGEVMVGIVCSATLLLMAFGMTKFFNRVPVAERVLLGVPIVLVSNGEVMQDRLRREGVSRDDLASALRDHGLTEPSQAAMVVLELDGTINVVPMGVASRIDSDLL